MLFPWKHRRLTAKSALAASWRINTKHGLDTLHESSNTTEYSAALALSFLVKPHKNGNVTPHATRISINVLWTYKLEEQIGGPSRPTEKNPYTGSIVIEVETGDCAVVGAAVVCAAVVGAAVVGAAVVGAAVVGAVDSEALWLPEDVAVGVGGGVIVLEIVGLSDGERLPDSVEEVLLEGEGDVDTDAEVEPLDDWESDTDVDEDREMLLEAVSEALWLADDVSVGVGGGVIVLVIDGLSDAEMDKDVDSLLEVEGVLLLEGEGDVDTDDDGEPLVEGLDDTEWERD